MGEI
jgi:class 3 adenylate cyclase